MRGTLLLLVGLLGSCADEPGIVLCVDAERFQEGDDLELQVTFASTDRGPTCAVIRRAARPLPYCVSATRGKTYAYAMALQAVWSREGVEVGRRATVVPYVDGTIVEADVFVGDCCAPSSPERQCLETGCSPIPEGTLDFFGELVQEEERCEN